MEGLKSAMDKQTELISDMLLKFSSDLRSGFIPAYHNFLGFFHAIDWKEPWFICLMVFHLSVFLVIIISRKKTDFQMCLFLLALAAVYLAERLNNILSQHWRSFAGQNYFDSHGIFVSVLWSGPLLVYSIIILINTLLSLCQLIVKWKRAELRHRARLARDKLD